ncbi:MAG: hypothetical protein IPI41_12205 [Flavobacteriales bacterium]|nr:hypothetical protein [Flavobacteriales bacterium]
MMLKSNSVDGYKYAEFFSGSLAGTALDPNADVVKRFNIVHYTNSDKNVMSSKGVHCDALRLHPFAGVR